MPAATPLNHHELANSRPSGTVARQTLLETTFPFAQVSAVALADRSSRDRTYAAHKWWARRPPAVIRALLLAAVLPSGTSSSAFWRAYADDTAHLEGHHVGDPFMGGATTAVEAARLGAAVTGIDVDPLAVRIARQELEGVDAELLRAGGKDLIAHLNDEVGHLFGTSEVGATPLHHFFVREVACPSCSTRSLLYRDLVLARDAGKAGGVVRDVEISAFCPSCRSVHDLTEGEGITCCGRRWDVSKGTFVSGRFHCPACDGTATHQQLLTGRADRVLVGIEETTDARRRVRSPLAGEDGLADAARWWDDHDLPVPATPLGAGETARARRYGFERIRDLFSPRQLALFASAFAYLDGADVEENVRNGLRLAVSNALAANNLLCGYATNYGRLAPLFTGVRAYAMPVLSVELNPLHPTGGRGTLAATIRRVAQTDVPTVRRHTFDPQSEEITQQDFLARRDVPTKIACRSADRGLPADLGKLTAAVSDPPYFDYISYSDLSLFFRAWHGAADRAERLGGAPIYPVGPDAATMFRDRLAGAFKKLGERLEKGAPFCFTFHATSAAAWDALGQALRTASFTVVAAFPVWADGRAASHSHEGNCEWDLVFVCRRYAPASKALPDDITAWLEELVDFKISTADRENLRMGLETARGCAGGTPEHGR
jgi:putative DNA methylase